jgi:hypothetical protein
LPACERHDSIGAVTANSPRIELRQTAPNRFALVSHAGGREVVIRDDLLAGETQDMGGGVYDDGVRVAVFQAGDLTAVRVRTAHGNRYANDPEWTTEEWFESVDGGQQWRKRQQPLDGAPVTQLSKGGVYGWTG